MLKCVVIPLSYRIHRNLVAFHYGNITHPSVDPPRIGILSLVPSNVDELYATAVSDALNNGGNFEGKDHQTVICVSTYAQKLIFPSSETIDLAPTASAANSPQTAVSVGSSSSLTHISTTSMSSTMGNLATPTGGAQSISSAFSNIRTRKEDVFSCLLLCLILQCLIKLL